MVKTLNDYVNPEEEAALSEYAKIQARGSYSWNFEKMAENPAGFRFINETRVLSSETTRCLQTRTKDLRCSLNALLVSAYLRAASRLDPAEGPLILQIPTSGKIYPEVDASHVLGCFAQNLSLSFDRPTPGETAEDTVSRVHEIIQRGLAWGYDRTQARQIGALVRTLPLENGGLSATTKHPCSRA